MCLKTAKDWVFLIISEVAFYFFFVFLTQIIDSSQPNVWYVAFVLWILINIAIALCPVCRSWTCSCNPKK